MSSIDSMHRRFVNFGPMSSIDFNKPFTEIVGKVSDDTDENLSEFNMDQGFTSLQCSSSSGEDSLNSSYADLFEASGVIIRDYQGSFSKDPFIVNRVTYNLYKCKAKVVVPYYKLLCLIAWRPFGKEYYRGRFFLKLLNFFYTCLTFCILLFWYVIRVYTCQGWLVIDNFTESTTPSPTTNTPLTISPNISEMNWTNTVPARLINKTKEDIILDPDFNVFIDPCQHVFGTYIVPNILHFIAFVIGFYHFRIQEHEGLYALMEKVYLQSMCPDKMTKRLRLYLTAGMIWLFFSLCTMVQYFFAFGFDNATGVSLNSPIILYTMMFLIILSGLMSNSVNLAVVLSYCGQCKLLIYYLDGVIERLEEKSTELKTAMKDVLVIKSHFNRLNGMLSFSTSCIVFDMIILVLITSVLVFNFRDTDAKVWWYRVAVGTLWAVMLIFLLVQASLLTSRSTILKEKALSIRVFGYQAHTQLEIDSFLSFLNMTELQAEIFTIPVKPRYLWAILIFSVQVLILMFQTGRITQGGKWL